MEIWLNESIGPKPWNNHKVQEGFTYPVWITFNPIFSSQNTNVSLDMQLCINNCLLPFKKINCLLVETKVIIIKRRGGEDNLFCEWSLPNLLGKTNFKFVNLLSKCKIFNHVRIVWVLELWKLGIKLSARYGSYQTTTLLLKHLPIWWWISWLSVELINSIPM